MKHYSKTNTKHIEPNQALDIVKYLSIFTAGTISIASLYAFYFRNDKNKIYKIIDQSVKSGVRFIDNYFLFYIKFIEAIKTKNKKFIDEIVDALKYSEKIKKEGKNIDFNFFSLADLEKHKKCLTREERIMLDIDSYKSPLYYCIKARNVDLLKTLVNLYGDSLLKGSGTNSPIILDLLLEISYNIEDKDLDKMFDILINPKYNLQIFSSYYKSKNDIFNTIMSFNGYSDKYLIKIMKYIECRYNRKIVYDSKNQIIFVKNRTITNKNLSEEEENLYANNFKYLFYHPLFKTDYYKDIIYNNFIKNN